ncbi:DUF2737 family protein [Cronobacter malonaticus]|uniref:DUF2737 family protein n=1 Tax=Cronobacter malonaticus TaxID=413503 RepID=UPI000CFA8979|nr:DUF2737 family protein [Cronobacter malonaticus]NCH31120.1 DUF2737 family protein [Cronobacter malonaticus]
MNDYYDPSQNATGTSAPKYEKRNSSPMPSREELMKRNSFGSVNNNRYLNRWFGAKK